MLSRLRFSKGVVELLFDRSADLSADAAADLGGTGGGGPLALRLSVRTADN